jgi:GAF domain-containing protein
VGSLVREIRAWLDALPAGAPPWEEALAIALRETAAQGGTIHLVDGAGRTLRLAAASAGIPAAVLDAVREIPVGRGMAGVAAERRAPVRTCDLQADDAGGAARPGAKATGLRGTICVPMIASDGRLAGTLGVGSVAEREFTPEEVAALLEAGRLLADR